MYKSFIIIGSKGLLGSALVKFLKSKKLKVISINKKNYSKKKNLYADVLINANGNSNKYFANNNPLADFKKSFLITYKTILDFKFKKYIYISSGDVYSSPRKNSTNEKMKIETPLNFYGKNKYLAEKFIQFYCNKWLILRLGPLIGAGLKKNAIYNIINNKKVFENMETKSSFINTYSVASILYRINKQIDNEIFNISGTGNISLKEIKKINNSNSKFDPKKDKKIYDISTKKISKYIKLPITSNEIKKFLKLISKNSK